MLLATLAKEQLVDSKKMLPALMLLTVSAEQKQLSAQCDSRWIYPLRHKDTYSLFGETLGL